MFDPSLIIVISAFVALVPYTWALTASVADEQFLLHFKYQDALARNRDAARRSPETMIKSYNYPFEEHQVTTEDGYILTMHRIPHGIQETHQVPMGEPRPAVLVLHGLLCSSADWIVTGPTKGLAFILADAGYDVWLGNARGNTFSRNHTTLATDSKEFWDFSWHEIGMKDLPAMIDYVIAHTSQPKIHYIGHSQGTTVFFVMASLRKEYNNKIILAQMLSPIAYMGHIRSPFYGSLLVLLSNTRRITSLLGMYEFLPSSEMMALGGYYACRDGSVVQEVCAQVLFLIGGYNSEQLNRTILPDILENIPAGASVGQMVHYGQEVQSGKFRQYDYGLLKNPFKYYSLTPPEYPVEKITSRIALHYSENDWLAAVQDVEKLEGRLSETVAVNRSLYANFNHFDYLWAIDANTLLYRQVVDLMASN